MLGMLGGYMFDNVQLNENSGSQDINSVRIGPCGKWLHNNLYATGAVTYGYHGVQASRKIQFGTIDLQADADYSMHDISPFCCYPLLLSAKLPSRRLNNNLTS